MANSDFDSILFDVPGLLVILKSAQQPLDGLIVRGLLQLEYHPDSFTEFLGGFLAFQAVFS